MKKRMKIRKRKKKRSKRRAEARNQNVPSAQSSISPRPQHIGIMPAREILLLLLLLLTLISWQCPI